MIRPRREEDVGRLVAVLTDLAPASAVLAGRDPRDWLEEHEGEVTWVYDMAPVRVAPTRNVVAHVQVHRLDPRLVTEQVLEEVGRPADELLAIGRLFVRRDTFEHGIGRHLLREATAYVHARGKVAVVAPEGRAFLPEALFRTRGFRALPGSSGLWFGDSAPSV